MNNLGLIYIRQDRFEDALRPLARAAELRGNSPVFQNNLGMALERSGHLTAARGAYAAALEADSTYEKASASLTRLGGPVDPADTAGGVDLAAISREFQGTIEAWRASADSTAVTARDTAVTAGDTSVTE